jgi:hypothetical protein
MKILTLPSIHRLGQPLPFLLEEESKMRRIRTCLLLLFHLPL